MKHSSSLTRQQAGQSTGRIEQQLATRQRQADRLVRSRVRLATRKDGDPLAKLAAHQGEIDD